MNEKLKILADNVNEATAAFKKARDEHLQDVIAGRRNEGYVNMPLINLQSKYEDSLRKLFQHLKIDCQALEIDLLFGAFNKMPF